MDYEDLEDEVAQSLVGGVEPRRIEAYRFALGILPIFRLVRALFSLNELDTCLKLMLLHELSRARGRATIDRIRGLVGFLPPDTVERLVRSLKDGGWLTLRGADNSYAVSHDAMHLLTLLHGAELDNLTPANVLSRVAQTAEFNATLDGGGSAVALLLDYLHNLVDEEVEQAHAVFRTGRPFRMIQWSRKEHARQLETIRAVLAHLSDRLDAASHELARVVRLHESLQELVRMHTSIHTRLREWNLERLHTSEAGYSIPQLVEATLGVDDHTLERDALPLIADPGLAPSLTLDELRARFHAARRKLDSAQASYTYTPVAPAPHAAWETTDIDRGDALRAELTALLEGRDGVELSDWLDDATLPAAAGDLAALATIAVSGRFTLDDGREARVTMTPAVPRDVAPDDLVPWLVRERLAVRLGFGPAARVRVEASDD